MTEAIIDATENAEEFTPEAEAVVTTLATLSIIEYEKVRLAKAKELGFRPSILDALVKAARAVGGGGADSRGGRVMEHLEPDPWPEPVDGDALVRDIEQAIDRYVFLPSSARLAVTLWVVMGHAFEAVRVSPRLLISSPTRRCGKTRLLEVVAELASRVEAVSSISASAIFRAIEAWAPTLLIDEADTFMRDNEELRGVVNSGHRPRFAHVVRIEEVGGERVPVRFSTWAPMAIAGIDKPGDTIVDRSVVIDLQRRPPGVKVGKLTPHGIAELMDLKRQAMRWARDNLDRIAATMPDVPDLENDRAEENWTPLMSIAQVAGGDVAERARVAARELLEGEFEDEPAGITLLRDLQVLFDDIAGRAHDNDRIPSEEIVKTLNEDDRFKDRPWPGWRRGKGLSQNSLARLLKPYKIGPDGIRLSDGRTPRGYRRQQFEAAWRSYLGAEREHTALNPGFKVQHRHKPQNSAENSGNKVQQEGGDVALENAEKSQNSGRCGGVAVETPESGEAQVIEL